MRSFLHIMTYYYMLLHIVAFANTVTMSDLVLTGPRASTPEILENPDDASDVPELYPQIPDLETDVHERHWQKSTAVLQSLDPGAILARLSVPKTHMTMRQK